MDLTVVIPVYNEAENLETLHERLQAVLPRLGLAYEILFVDDGSVDRSAEVLRKLLSIDPRVRVITFEHNAGQSAAFGDGLIQRVADSEPCGSQESILPARARGDSGG